MLDFNDRRSRKFALGTALAGVMACTVAAAPMGAHAADDFYKGKKITLIISAGPGGGYATYALTMTKHMTKHIPGNPDFIRQHRQGAAGIVAANYLYSVAKKDGTVVAAIHRGAVSTSAVWKDKGVNYDPTRFGWIGSINRGTSFCVSYHTSPVKTFEDAKTTPLIVGGLAAGSDTDTFPNLFNNLLGTRFKLVTGYNQGTAISLAMERGEVQGRCGWSWSSIVATKGDWLREKKINLLVQIALSRNPDVPKSVPMITDFAKDEDQRDILKLVLAPQEMARPLLAPPGLPADRLEMLQAGFDATMKDPEFLKEAKERKLDVSPLSGPQIQALIESMFRVSPEVVAAAKDALTRTDKMQITVKKLDLMEVKAKLDGVKRQGRVIAFKGKDGAAHEAKISGSRTKVSIAGKSVKRAELKSGMSCLVTYAGDKGEAKSVACD